MEPGKTAFSWPSMFYLAAHTSMQGCITGATTQHDKKLQGCNTPSKLFVQKEISFFLCFYECIMTMMGYITKKIMLNESWEY